MSRLEKIEIGQLRQAKKDMFVDAPEGIIFLVVDKNSHSVHVLWSDDSTVGRLFTKTLLKATKIICQSI